MAEQFKGLAEIEAKLHKMAIGEVKELNYGPYEDPIYIKREGILFTTREESMDAPITQSATLEQLMKDIVKLPSPVTMDGVRYEREETNNPLTVKQLLMEKIGDKLPVHIPEEQELNKPVLEFKEKGNAVWYKIEHDFKAIKLQDGPYTPEERRDIMSKALYGEDKEQAEAKSEIAKVVKQPEIEKEFQR